MAQKKTLPAKKTAAKNSVAGKKAIPALKSVSGKAKIVKKAETAKKATSSTKTKSPKKESTAKKAVVAKKIAPAKKTAPAKKAASRKNTASAQTSAPAKRHVSSKSIVNSETSAPTIVSINTVMRNIPKRPISMAVLGQPDKALTKAELAKFKKELLKLRDKVYLSVDAARQNVRHHNEADNSGDDGASIFDKFLALERAGSTKDILNRIDEALARIEDGTYGKCLACGNPIRRVRLEVRPFSKYCIKCQEQLEKEQESEKRR